MTLNRRRVGKRYVANIGSLEPFLKDNWKTTDLVTNAAEQVAERAKSLAPVETGEYRDSITVEVDEHETRTVAHVGATVPYSGSVEAAHGTMRKALG